MRKMIMHVIDAMHAGNCYPLAVGAQLCMFIPDVQHKFDSPEANRRVRDMGAAEARKYYQMWASGWDTRYGKEWDEEDFQKYIQDKVGVLRKSYKSGTIFYLSLVILTNSI